MIIGDKASVNKNKQTVVYPMEWPKHDKVISLISFSFLLFFWVKNIFLFFFSTWFVPCQFLTDVLLWKQIQSSLVDEIPGPSTYVSKYANPWVDLKMFHDDAVYNYSDDFPYEGFDEDYVYDEDEFEDDGYDASPFENDYNYSLSSKFDNLDIPPGAEVSLPWMQKAAIEIGNKSKPTKIMDDKIQEKYKAFKQFDTVDDHSDHYFSKPELRKVQAVKKVSVFLHALSTLRCLNLVQC